MTKIKPLNIGKIQLKNNLVLAPMVDVTDLPFRLLCKKSGASLVFTEMLYSSQIIHENKKTLDLMKFSEKERPIGIQITGNSEEEIESTLPHLKNYDLIDINCGCPSIKITGNEAGSYLLKNPKKISNFIKILKKSGKPVTAKIRLGFKKNNVVEIAKEIEESGADAITVHARLAIHGRSTPADWSEIRKVKESVSIPVIANGDIFSGKDVESVIKQTNCDGVMIARGAIGDPLIFKRIITYLRTGREPAFNSKENIKQFREYIRLAKNHEVFNLDHIKYLGARFLKGFEGAPKFRAKFMKLKTEEEIEEFVENLSILH